jgi:hypothetical protein
MGWAPDPAKQQAADEAEREAQEAIARRLDAHADAKLSPFERKLLGLLEDVRDAIKAPGAGPVLATLDPNARVEAIAAIKRALPEGSIITGPNGPILDVTPLAGVPVVNSAPAAELDGLLDAEPTELGRAIEAAARALFDAFPAFRDDLTASGFERLAEVAIEAALASAARKTSPGQDAAEEDGAAGGDSPPIPPADNPE